jgi:transcriptional regulator with XRE-family HTH domain
MGKNAAPMQRVSFCNTLSIALRCRHFYPPQLTAKHLNSQQLITALKRELKSRDLTYATLAQRIGMSEASIKRMLASGRLSLDQLDAMLTATGIDWTDLVQAGAASEPLLALRPWMPPSLRNLREHPLVESSTQVQA